MRKIKTKGKINHLVRSYPNPTNTSFAYSSLQDNKVQFYEPFDDSNEEREKKKKNQEIKADEQEEDDFYVSNFLFIYHFKI